MMNVKHHLMVTLAALLSLAAAQKTWALENGFNVLINRVDRQDYNDMAAAGAEIVRISMAQKPLIVWQRNANRYGQYNDSNWDLMHEHIGYARDAGLKVIIDPHAVTGANVNYTLLATAPFYQNTRFKNDWVSFWKDLTRDLKQYGNHIIWGFELINEPVPSRLQGNVVDINQVYRQLVNAIHNIDNRRRLILNLHGDDYASYVKAPAWYGGVTNKLVFGPHMYWPLDYTHQVREGNTGVPYPNPEDESSYFDMLHGEGNWQSVIDWKRAHGAQMFVGELGVEAGVNAGYDTRYQYDHTPTNGGHLWYYDTLRILNDNNISYTFHSYRSPQPGFDHREQIHRARWLLVSSFLNNDRYWRDPGPPVASAPWFNFIAFEGFEDFENGPFTGGYGKWRGRDWSIIPNNGFDSVVSSRFARSGDLSAKLIRKSGITRRVDLRNKNTVRLEFYYRTQGLENNEKLRVYVNDGASGDVKIGEYSRAEWQWRRVFVDLTNREGTDYDFRGNFEIIFVGGGSGSTEFTFIDDIRVY